MNVQRSAWRGQAADCKTATSKAPIPLLEPLRCLLHNFKESQTVLDSSQHILVNSLLRPLDLGGRRIASFGQCSQNASLSGKATTLDAAALLHC